MKFPIKHHHSIVTCEPGQVLIEAAISISTMWMMMLDGDFLNET
jgi:hypothetical protein